MNNQNSSWLLDSQTRASNPGRVHVNRITWLVNYPLWPVTWSVLLGLAVVFALLLHWSIWFAAALLLLVNWLYWQQVSAHFSEGCANPGMVVQTNPVLIAVATDLTKGVGAFPVVKIFEKNMKTVNGLPPQPGTRLATIALYSASANDEDPHWEDFDPRLVNCGNSSPAAVQQVMATFTESDWQKLHYAINTLPRPFVPGLYHVKSRF